MEVRHCTLVKRVILRSRNKLTAFPMIQRVHTLELLVEGLNNEKQ